MLNSYFWQYDMYSDFPLGVIDYEAHEPDARNHWHDYLELALCTGGTGRFLFSQRQYDVQPGDVFLASNFENHVAVTDGASETKYILVLFRSELIAPPGCRELDREYLHPFMYDPAGFTHRIAADSPYAGEIAGYIGQLKRVWDERAAGYRQMSDALLRCALAVVCRHYSQAGGFSGNVQRSRGEIHNAIQYIDANYDKPMTLCELAELTHMSETRFRQLFRQAMGMAFKEYVAYLRLTKAKRLLVVTGYSIAQVASESGFSNINQFYKMFNKYVGVSPAQYRRTKLARM